MAAFEVPDVELDRYSNRQLAAVPLAVLGAALLVLVAWSLFVAGTPSQPAAPVSLGIEFTGGTELTVEAPGGRPAIESAFRPEIASVRQIRGESNTYLVTFQTTDADALQDQAAAAGLDVTAIRSTSATFGGNAQQQALYGVVLAFLGMSVVVFLLFRSFVPSVAVVVSAFSDIVVPLALMDVLGIQLTLGTVAALLMLIGYSVDSDILLNNHVLRRSGGFYESAYRAMRTGVTMTVTSIAAMAVMAAVAYFFGIQLLASIGVVLVMGLAADLMNTYMLNMSLLRWYKFEGVAR